MYTRLILFAFAASLAGCSTTARYAGNENSPYYVVPAGSHVVLNQALTVPPEEAGVFIQNGEARPRGQVRFSEPYCRLTLKTVRGTSRSVAPDEMVVRKSMQQTLRTFSGIAGEQYASASIVLAASPGDRDDSSSTIQTFATHMDLDSQKQPDVDRLICAKVGYRGEDQHVTIAEMRSTLGNIVTLRFPHQVR
jgi:hypothetical protein